MTTHFEVSTVAPQGGYVAKQCPVRIQNDIHRPSEPLEASAEVLRMADGIAFEASVIEEFRTLAPPSWVFVGEDLDRCRHRFSRNIQWLLPSPRKASAPYDASDRIGGGSMHTYGESIDILETELNRVQETFAGLTPEEWAMPTKLAPLDPTKKPWTAFELAGHFDISIGLTRMLVDSKTEGQPGRDRTSFFIFPRSEVAPVVYDYAFTMVEGKTPADMPERLHEVFTKTIEESRANPPETIGSGYYALMELGEFVPSRIVEAVVHGLDLTDALGREPIATPEGVKATAAILDELLARRTVGGRPADLADDMAWVRAASGRGPHEDPRLPLIG